MFRRRWSLVLARFEPDVAELLRGGPALLRRIIRVVLIGVAREGLVRLLKRRVEIRGEGFGDGHRVRVADEDYIVAGGIEFALPFRD